MKRVYVSIVFILICLTLFSGCTNQTPEILYHINETYITEVCDFTVTHNQADEQFILDYRDKSENTHLYLSFVFTDDADYLVNSAEFAYTDGEGNAITFNEDGYYVCNGDFIFCVSYRNANEQIKSAIADKTCSIHFGFATFIFFNMKD